MRLSLVLVLSFLAVPAHAKEWGDVRTPVPGPARVLGGPVAGCLAGAERLPPEGLGYQAVRVSRNRHWGHPTTVAFVKDMGARARQAGFGDLYIGDLAQPRGGPMASLHGSHQNGLDVDIWFNLDPKPALAAPAREDIAIVRLTAPDERSVDPALWRPEHARVLRMAADDPRVDRILVHFAIKKHLCETAGPDRAWLRKVRPWRGHLASRPARHARSCPRSALRSSGRRKRQSNLKPLGGSEPAWARAPSQCLGAFSRESELAKPIGQPLAMSKVRIL